MNHFTTTKTLPQERYYVSDKGQRRGPFDRWLIEAMVLAEVFSADTLICKEGMEDWLPFVSEAQPPPLPNGEMVKPKKKRGRSSFANIPLIVIGTAIGLFLIISVVTEFNQLSKSNLRSSSKTKANPSDKKTPSANAATKVVATPSPTKTPNFDELFASSSSSKKQTTSTVKQTPSNNEIAKPTPTPPIAIATPLQTSYSPANSSPSKPTYSLPSPNANSTFCSDTKGRTYSVPNSRYEEILAKNKELDGIKKLLNSEQKALESLATEVGRLGGVNMTTQRQRDLYKNKVNEYNSNWKKNQDLGRKLNELEYSFNRKLKEVGTLVSNGTPEESPSAQAKPTPSIPQSSSSDPVAKSTFTLPVAVATPSQTSYLPPSYTPSIPIYSASGETTDSTLYRDAQGRTYRVSNSDYHRLLAKKQELDSKERLIELSEKELDSLDDEITRLRRRLDRTSQYQIDSFNRKVDTYNDERQQLQRQIDSFNRSVNAFNDELERVGTLIR